ncbi:MAG: SprT family zinc-dependent metalloprotease [bacterium]|nr:SprT family zinc-dependent metalloprotease [bacterium]
MEEKVSYKIKRSHRAKRVRLAVYCDGSVVVTLPIGVQETLAEKFVREKSQWLLSKLAFFKQFQGSSLTHYGHKEYLKHKEEASELATARVKYYNRLFGFSYNTINIKNQRTRWGSCSKKGNLNFNYKIALLPSKLADYIIVHELCHLGEFNHSRKFWNLVSNVFPNFRELRNEMKKSGVILS